MRKNLSLLIRVLSLALIVSLVFSCRKQNVKQVNIDNQFAISIFSDTIKIGDLLNNMDSTVSEFIKVKEDGSIYAYFSDSIKNAVVAQDVLGKLDDVSFESNTGISLPNLPPSPVEIPLNLPFEDLFSIPFEYEGYEISSVILKSGIIALNIQCDLDIIEELTLTSDEIEMNNGDSFEFVINFDSNDNSSTEIDLTNCTIRPRNNNVVFSINLKATVPANQGYGGIYTFNIEGAIKDIEFESIDGAIQDTRFDFSETSGLNLSFPNLYGDLQIATPEFTISYINTFGFETNASIDSLYLIDASGNMTSIIKDWNPVELSLYSTGESYGIITDLDEQLIDNLNLLDDYKEFTFKGNVVLGCDNVADNMISDDSHIDIIADLSLPLEFNIEKLSFIDTLDFDLDLVSSENDVDDEVVSVEDIFDEIEFKFVFENALPLQIKPQAYLLMNDQLIDSLFDGNTLIHANNNGNITEDVLEVHVTGDKLLNIQNADKILLNIGISSLNENVVINTNDYFNLRIGVKTKTTEINLDDLNF